ESSLQSILILQNALQSAPFFKPLQTKPLQTKPLLRARRGLKDHQLLTPLRTNPPASRWTRPGAPTGGNQSQAGGLQGLIPSGLSRSSIWTPRPSGLSGSAGVST